MATMALLLDDDWSSSSLAPLYYSRLALPSVESVPFLLNVISNPLQ
jgi:hypothetical protein